MDNGQSSWTLRNAFERIVENVHAHVSKIERSTIEVHFKNLDGVFSNFNCWISVSEFMAHRFDCQITNYVYNNH